MGGPESGKTCLYNTCTLLYQKGIMELNNTVLMFVLSILVSKRAFLVVNQCVSIDRILNVIYLIPIFTMSPPVLASKGGGNILWFERSLILCESRNCKCRSILLGVCL